MQDSHGESTCLLSTSGAGISASLLLIGAYILRPYAELQRVKLTGLAEESAPMEAMTGVIQDVLSILGADELTGDMRAPSPPKKTPTNKIRPNEVEPALAAMNPSIRGGKRQGTGSKPPVTALPPPTVEPKPTEPAPRRPFCPDGPECTRFGSLARCPFLHTDKDMDKIRAAKGDLFVSAKDRLRFSTQS